MEKVKTNNIISTPDITGNIGSCTSQSVVVDTDYNIITSSYKTVVTNSCTGEVSQYDSWALGAFPWAVIVLGILMLWMIIGSSTPRGSSW